MNHTYRAILRDAMCVYKECEDKTIEVYEKEAFNYIRKRQVYHMSPMRLRYRNLATGEIIEEENKNERNKRRRCNKSR